MDIMENIISLGTPVTIEGKEYMIRRLNTRDVFKVAGILGKVYRPGMTYAEGNEASFAATLMSAIPVAEESIITFLASILNLTVEEFDNLPPDALFDVIEGLAKSEDLKRFFDKVKGLMGRLNLETPAQV